ncbi:hypothetical protein [Flagellimonas lutaonensis]|uniref:Uncharacterized protein n=1 Tax=Flagellimonas lutaonensis TaxID=516051 RepID=A0A0D5YQN5_9FLAO|nr:hypothetical protein [Allomuricauda lutaonensis]AKA34239.1 hypothetical protein VC82_566 [Allomuricauda lutaonensis]
MARRLYFIIMLVAIGLAIYLYTARSAHTQTFIIAAATLLFMFFGMGIHGLIAHSLNPKVKGGLLIYPLLMGALWAVLFLLFVFFILPIFCPDFLISP